MAPPTSSSGLSPEWEWGLRELERGTRLCLPALPSNPTSLETHWKRSDDTMWRAWERKALFDSHLTDTIKAWLFRNYFWQQPLKEEGKKKKGIKLDLFPSVLWYRADAAHSQHSLKKKKSILVPRSTVYNDSQRFTAHNCVNVGLWEWPHLAFFPSMLPLWQS